MAVLTSEQAAALRRKMYKRRVSAGASVDYDKAVIDAALQAIEDLIEGNKTAINNAINTATSPYVFSADDKRFLLAYYFAQKAIREEAG